MPPPPKCRWTDREGRTHDCHLDQNRWTAGYDGHTHCIFHAQKKDPKEFRESLLLNLIREWIENESEQWDFSGFIFPEDIAVADITPKRDEEGRPQFPEAVEFWNVRFSGRASFQSARFTGSASFVDARFCDVSFRRALFEKDALLGGARFSAYAEFSESQFSGLASFVNTQFGSQVNFWSIKFSKSAIFDGAQFHGFVSFWSAQFRRNAEFEYTLFKNSVSLLMTSFATEGNFEGCQIKNAVTWTWPGKGKAAGDQGNKIERGVLRLENLDLREGILDLRQNTLADDTTLMIHHCDMSRILLEGTDCTQIKFYDNRWPSHDDRFDAWFVRWLPRNWRRSKRTIVGDERLDRENEPEQSRWHLIQLTYQQLARRFREDFDHQKANEFDRGVFEMRRLAARSEGTLKGRLNYALISIYKYLSHYSGNMLLPAFWWLLLVMVCAVGYGALTSGVVWGVWDPHFMLSKLAESLVAGFSVTVTPGEEPLVQIIKVAQKAFSATLITLFIFAVRRRFKH